MAKRIVSGAVYCVIIVGFFLLRQFVDTRLFTILPWIFSIIGSIEMANAMKEKIDRSEYLLTIFAGATAIPVYAVFKYLLNLYTFAFTLTLAYVTLIILLCILLAVIRNNRGVNKETKEIDFRGFFYPVILLIFMADCNSFLAGRGLVSLLLIFVISALTDTFAYFVGITYSAIKKGEAKKLCPKLSPKKTVAGAIGGLVGGILGAIIVAILFKDKILFFEVKQPVLLFSFIGLGGAIVNQVGDLFESKIKRSLGIKDMGNIMPGHGGVMDRIDGILLLSVYIFLIFMFI